MCDAHLHDGPLTCQRTDTHERGHVFVAAWLPDRHDEDGGEE